jgi:hypothetical protein
MYVGFIKGKKTANMHKANFATTFIRITNLRAVIVRVYCKISGDLVRNMRYCHSFNC